MEHGNRWLVLTTLAVLATADLAMGQGGLTATLVANDDIRAEWINVTTNVVGGTQVHPAGPLVAAYVQTVATHLLARHSCSLGSSGGGKDFAANSFCVGTPWPLRASVHSDLTLTVFGTGAVSIGAETVHWGDSAAGSIRVDIGDDGTDEVTTACVLGCASPTHHRLWTWDFAHGNLVIRIRTDQVTYGGAQEYFLDLRIRPWSGHATHITPGCGGLGVIRDSSLYFEESSNYELAADPATSASELLALRAYGFGDLGFFVASDSGSLTMLQPPSPLTACFGLANILIIEPGTVRSRTTVGSPAIPREWRFAVPLLPPGLRFYVQHGSLRSASPLAFGTTNVIRIDT